MNVFCKVIAAVGVALPKLPSQFEMSGAIRRWLAEVCAAGRLVTSRSARHRISWGPLSLWLRVKVARARN